MKKLSLIFLFFTLIHTQAFALTLQSSAFKHEQMIPAKYTCDGANYSPALSWQEAPEDTKSYVLFLEDPDASAGTWDHWVLYNIPATVHELPENIKKLPGTAKVTNNSWRQGVYNGPCPPNSEHRYFFKLFALDKTLNLNDGATRSDIEKAMKNHVLEKTELIGRYARKKNNEGNFS